MYVVDMCGSTNRRVVMFCILGLFICSRFYLASATDCPDVWIAFQGSCYFMHNDGKSFTEAEHYCNQHASHLVHIDNADESAFLKDRVTHEYPQTHWWIGLTDEEIEGIYKWVDNNEELTKESFTDWMTGEPSDSGHSEDCVHFWYSNGYQWNDALCDIKHAFICELRSDEGGPIAIG